MKIKRWYFQKGVPTVHKTEQGKREMQLLEIKNCYLCKVLQVLFFCNTLFIYFTCGLEWNIKSLLIKIENKCKL